jgi:prevent-host-death family protein
MKSVNIAELKNRLSLYLNDVKAGEEILVRDRNQPVARIVPLVRSRDEFWEMPAPRVPAAALRRAVEEERDEN